MDDVDLGFPLIENCENWSSFGRSFRRIAGISQVSARDQPGNSLEKCCRQMVGRPHPPVLTRSDQNSPLLSGIIKDAKHPQRMAFRPDRHDPNDFT
ncbi:hypothetical protein [Pseudophaeobacter leonis]|uniref:hypothetical protein n=1 Tax=Pseudophaeobacter leonis TaxID=1144477 RepID=UPI0013747879|nr:hypothetical protein [Pseudophaeobacter leonis]